MVVHQTHAKWKQMLFLQGCVTIFNALCHLYFASENRYCVMLKYYTLKVTKT
jgi:hypothetical protein